MPKFERKNYLEIYQQSTSNFSLGLMLATWSCVQWDSFGFKTISLQMPFCRATIAHYFLPCIYIIWLPFFLSKILHFSPLKTEPSVSRPFLRCSKTTLILLSSTSNLPAHTTLMVQHIYSSTIQVANKNIEYLPGENPRKTYLIHASCLTTFFCHHCLKCAFQKRIATIPKWYNPNCMNFKKCHIGLCFKILI